MLNEVEIITDEINATCTPCPLIGQCEYINKVIFCLQNLDWFPKENERKRKLILGS
jgi:hypothetical protein